jgi:hypothetical protein
MEEELGYAITDKVRELFVNVSDADLNNLMSLAKRINRNMIDDLQDEMLWIEVCIRAAIELETREFESSTQ